MAELPAPAVIISEYMHGHAHAYMDSPTVCTIVHDFLHQAAQAYHMLIIDMMTVQLITPFGLSTEYMYIVIISMNLNVFIGHSSLFDSWLLS